MRGLRSMLAASLACAGCASSSVEPVEPAADASAEASPDAGADTGEGGEAGHDADASLDAPDAGDEADAAHDADAPAEFAPRLVSSSADTYLEAEPSVAAGPAGRVVVAWVAGLNAGGASVAYAFSSDHGLHTTPPSLAPSPELGLQLGDPTVAFADDGTAYLALLAFDGAGIGVASRVYVASAAPGTDTFGDFVRADPPGAGSVDMPWLSRLASGRLVATWSAEGRLGLSTRTDADAGFAAQPFAADGSAIGWATTCAAGPSGRAYAAYVVATQSGLTVTTRVVFRRSDDGGASWSDATQVALPAGSPPAVLDPVTCVADGDDVWFAIAAGTDAWSIQGADMQRATTAWVTHSPDGGASFDRTVAAADASGGDRYLHPYLVGDAASLAVVFYAGHEPDDAHASLRLARSLDRGATFGASTALTSASLRLLTARSDYQWLGDYTSAVLDDGALLVAFTTNEASESHVALVRRALP